MDLAFVLNEFLRDIRFSYKKSSASYTLLSFFCAFIK
ncbi:hypothetical protein HMPREF1076_03269 [Parabacteroides goldsteinii CL02T12C30]|uniref:Uncharacterized protein n=1 Tax=Parabacteroides goldsteinii CL02T12C30 TaxID=999418 RepID=K5ZMP6_9BACT|nr:hypothetical protein HMPREF1076_03269 [Parabacteroides goldsteinii CL02T12C30]